MPEQKESKGMSCEAMNEDWWSLKPRKVSVIVDNNNKWFVPYARQLCARIENSGDNASFYLSQNDIQKGDIAFYLSCINITPIEILKKHRVNLVCHASALPKGKGFSPVTWQILEGKNEIPFSLFEMVETLDAGPIVLRDTMFLDGTELLDSIREKQAQKTIDMCLRYLAENKRLLGKSQRGKETVYKRRFPKDSKLDINVPLIDQMNLLRVSDNENYPAFFIYKNKKYILKIF